MLASRQPSKEQDLFLDSAALNLHDFYAGLERIFEQIASSVDRSVPSEHDRHRALLRQMTIEVQELRPQILLAESAAALDEFLGFRHVVRNVYAFEFDPIRVE